MTTLKQCIIGKYK